MNERIKELRNFLKMNQEEFGKLLGITKSGVSEIESGRRKVTEQHIIMLQNHKVNEIWLRTGQGDMFIKPTKKDELILWASTVLGNESEESKNRFIDALFKLDIDDWELLANMAETLVRQK